MKCPRDGEELITKRYSGDVDFHVEICPKCHGVWFDKGELNLLVPELTIRLENMKWKPAPGSHPTVISPKSGQLCEALLLEVANDLIIDRDPVSGGCWVDGEEMEHLREFAKTACKETREHIDFVAEQMREMGFHH